MSIQLTPLLLPLLCFLLLPTPSLSAFQPLHLSQPVYLYRLNTTTYQLTYQISRLTSAQIYFCFAPTILTSTTPHQRNPTLEQYQLQKATNMYYCVYLHMFNDNPTGVYTQGGYQQINYKDIYTADSNVRRTEGLYNQPGVGGSTTGAWAVNPSVSLISESQAQKILITDLFQDRQFYHMLTCPQYDPVLRVCYDLWRQNFAHTFNPPQKRINLIVQRMHTCGVYSNPSTNTRTFVHIFYGGILRNEQYHMMLGILVYNHDAAQKLNMWGGIAYSYDHANRDMFCFATDGTHYDATSLLVGPVYQDIANNIGGVSNVQLVDNSYDQKYQDHYMYFVQYYRPYVSGDRVGDEVLFRKIYDSYAFVGYFRSIEGLDPGAVVTPSCLGNWGHNFMMGFDADVTVWGAGLRLWGVLMLGVVGFIGL